MKHCCDIIRDLLPLYIDGIESDESRTAVKEHLKFCPDCRRYYKSIGKALNIGAAEHIAGTSEDYTKISRKIRKRRGLYTGAAALTLLLFAAYLLYTIIKEKKR